MKNITINERFKALIRPLAKEELETLEANILRDGLRDPLVVWNGVLIDGHNRLEICHKHNLTPELREMQFADEDEACVWIIRNQLGRRNLTTIERVKLALELEPMLKAKAKEQQIRKPESVVQKSAQQKPAKTREEIAKLAGVSHDTVSKAKAVLESGKPELIQQVVSKEKSLNQAAKEVKRKLTEEEQAVEEKAEKRAQEAAKDSPKLWELKSAFRKASKKDRAQFFEWVKTEFEQAN